MSGCAKVYRITREELTRVLRGEARVRNLPGDAEVIAMQTLPTDRGGDVGLRVHSQSFPAIPHGGQLPVVIAVTEAHR